MLNLSTLVIGEKYEAYFMEMLRSLEVNCEKNNYKANVFLTTNLDFNLKKFNFINIIINKISININNFKEFPYYIKSMAIAFALNKLKNENDRLIHIDCDVLFYNKNLLKELSKLNKEGIYGKINITNYTTERLWRYPINGKLISLKHIFSNKLKYNLDDSNSYLQLLDWGIKGLFREKFEKINIGLDLNIPIKLNKTAWITDEPKISYYIYEGFLYFNINKNKLKNFCYYWYIIGSFIESNNIRSSGEAVDISIAAYLSKIDILFCNFKKFDIKFIDFGTKDKINYI